MVQWQCKEKQSVFVGVRYKNDRSRKNGKKAREHFFSVWALPSVFCSVRGTKGSPCISPPSLDRAHVVIFLLCSASGPFILVYRAMPAAYVCVRARIVLLLSKLLYFFLSFSLFLLFFLLLLFLLFALQLPCTRMCGCNSSIDSFLLLGAHSMATMRKKYGTRMHTYEQMRERKRERERPVDAITAYYCIYITSTAMLETLGFFVE